MALDVGLTWFGDPMALYAMPEPVQTDVLAYHTLCLEKGAATRYGLLGASRRTDTELALDALAMVHAHLKLKAAQFKGDADIPNVLKPYVAGMADEEDAQQRAIVSKRLQTESGADPAAVAWWLEQDG